MARMTRILTVLGARPQFIKAATVSRCIASRDGLEEVIVHTGQHFDANMSDVFFDQLKIPIPSYQLNISSLSHGALTGRMTEALEDLMVAAKPDWVLVYGDTNSTLAGALAAAKLHIPIAHVEAGLRSHNPLMPEEINRVLTDRVSSCLLCPTETAVQNLRHEGFPFKCVREEGTIVDQQFINVGDVMFDAALFYKEAASAIGIASELGLDEKDFVLCTLHRQENTDNPERLTSLLNTLNEIGAEQTIVLPLHPRTRTRIDALGIGGRTLSNIELIDPLPYLEMQSLLRDSSCLLTDSGGMQKEAYFQGVPCVTLRDETEWLETLDQGWNRIVGADPGQIVAAFEATKTLPTSQNLFFGDGRAAEKVVSALVGS